MNRQKINTIEFELTPVDKSWHDYWSYNWTHR